MVLKGCQARGVLVCLFRFLLSSLFMSRLPVMEKGNLSAAIRHDETNMGDIRGILLNVKSQMVLVTSAIIP